MKIRTDFVTNSSSSSFIVAFDKVPKTIKEMNELLFNEDQLKYGCMSYYDSLHSIDKISETILGDIESQTSKSAQDLFEIIDGGDPCEFTKITAPKWPDYTGEKAVDEKNWRKYEELSNIRAKDIAKNFIAKTKGKFIFTFEYGDHDHHTAAIEHGDVFKNLTHIRISRH